MSFYKRHIFFCTNDRGAGAERPSCNRCGSAEMRDYAKMRMKKLGLTGEGKVRVNKSGCLDRCEEGPA
ncbi:MAG: (2Fe-2S) ferredoxin domain-containing protein, partial [Xanthomonadales bacterium]|nr:(2Fe-2S) ferredoxin domain-containing protein [Xanthomonadales bacterium]